MSSNPQIILHPIGYVKTAASKEEVKSSSVTSQLVLQPQLSMALRGLEGFSHIYVLFYFNQLPKDQPINMQIHPKAKADLPLMGLFGTRTMFRPNPVGLTIVELVKVEGNVLTVQGLDAFDGTPILDIKPYDPYDKPEKAYAPNWWIKLYTEP
ncbi:MAG: tRNA (N6-threonylcarbamoyladenosine(37)-N6)-methyltransferase TrmO [Candidatus Bathyarchaeota archaeon]|nr:tRNA (N6-threonylcarbamoyladenosine(37)-N6)-methyltransferase TrmO [Candidatus Bathyarchaeota archaeon]